MAFKNKTDSFCFLAIPVLVYLVYNLFLHLCAISGLLVRSKVNQLDGRQQQQLDAYGQQ